MKLTKKKYELYLNLLLVSIFGIAMGFFEVVVVIYLRMIPAIKEFLILPLIPRFPHEIFLIEQLREISTIIMLSSFAILIGKTWWERLAVFLWVFAIWDIFYYVCLYFLIHWPPSLLTIDVVFLVPTIWYAPVIFAITVMLGFLMSSFYIFKKKCRGVNKISK
jgi:hypothetical protein